MNELTLRASTRFEIRADRILKVAAQSWFVVAAIGLWIFASYVALLYVGSALRGDFDAWNQVFPRGYVPGDTLGNLAVGAHVFIAVVIIAGGPLQLIPKIRARLPAFHRWNGRVFLSGACLASLAGLYLVWIRGGSSGSLGGHLGVTLNSDPRLRGPRHSLRRGPEDRDPPSLGPAPVPGGPRRCFPWRSSSCTCGRRMEPASRASWPWPVACSS